MTKNNLNFEDAIFKKGSKTYYNSSLFFPKAKRKDILKLYSFVRVVDDLVDNQPQQLERFSLISTIYRSHKPSKSLSNDDMRVITNIWSLEKEYTFDKKWVEAFLLSMEMDAKDHQYSNLEDTIQYIHGSAEVIGLMMSKILGLSKQSYPYAVLQGRSMQYINFIRDIKEDIGLGRCYFPADIRQKYNINEWDESIRYNPEFSSFIRGEISRYQEWQNEASIGWKYIPFRSRIAVKTASRMYNWTAQQIFSNPEIVFVKKVKPSKLRILLTGLYSVFL